MTLPLDGEFPEGREAVPGSAVVALGDAPKLIMLCGPAYSGKSTLARLLSARLDIEVVALDAIHAERGMKHPLPESAWVEAHGIAQRRIEDLLQSENSVILDDTNCYRFLRRAYSELAQEYEASVHLIVLRAERAAMEARRSLVVPGERHSVPEDILNEHWSTFEWPQENERALILDATDVQENLLKQAVAWIEGASFRKWEREANPN